MVTFRQVILAALTWMALAAMLLIVAIGELDLGSLCSALTIVIPAFSDERGSLLALGIAFGICLQIIFLVTGVLVGYVLVGRIFDRVALRLVDALVGTIALATVIVFGTFFHMPAPPFAILALAGTTLGVTIVLVVLVTRTLLRRAASQHAELEEVV